MKKFLRTVSAILLIAMLLSLAACKGKPTETTPEPATDAPVTEAPTEEPTEAPIPQPTEAPTEEPTEEPATYAFDPATRVYSDEYINFTVPEGEANMVDATEQMGAATFERYIMFTPNSQSADGTDNTAYYVLSTSNVPADQLYAYLSEEQIEAMFLQAYQQQFGEIDFNSEKYETVEAEGYSGIDYSFTVTLNGVELHQRIWSVVVNGKCLNVCYTWPGTMELEPTVDTITVK